MDIFLYFLFPDKKKIDDSRTGTKDHHQDMNSNSMK